MDSLENYNKKKEQLIKELQANINSGKNIGLGKNSSNLFRTRSQVNTKIIDVRNFNQVINIDIKNLIVEVEGMTTYEDLVAETLKYNLMPTVVPELKSITIGGAATGLGIESSSFKYGLVHETIKEIEVLLSNGTTVICTSNNKYKDLFFGFPNSYGTLGYALKIKVKLVPVKKYVKITRIRYNKFKDYFNHIKKYCNDNSIDFIDGTIFSENEMYITLGNFVDNASFVSNYKYINIYYKSIQSKKEDYLTTLDYIWRWDTDWFWCSKHFKLQNPIVRLLVGKFMLRSSTYWKIMFFNRKYNINDKFERIFGKKCYSESVIQDVEIPIENCEEFLEFFNKEIGIKPIWVCPIKLYNKKVRYSFYAIDPNKIYINFGFWDTIKIKEIAGEVYFNRKIENKVKKLNGKKSLYSTSFYTEEEFWKLYNKKDYEKLKNKYDSLKRLNNLYNKCVKNS